MMHRSWIVLSVLSLVACSAVVGCSRDDRDLHRVQALDARIMKDHPEIPDFSSRPRYYELRKTAGKLHITGVWMNSSWNGAQGIHIVKAPEKLPAVITHAGCDGGGVIKADANSYSVECDALMPLPPRSGS